MLSSSWPVGRLPEFSSPEEGFLNNLKSVADDRDETGHTVTQLFILRPGSIIRTGVSGGQRQEH